MITAPPYQHVSSGGLALAVHGLFLLALVVSVSWKNLPHLPVQADLWAALPEPVPLETEPPPEPEPAPVQTQPSEAEIALRKAEQEKQRLAAEELRKQEEARKLELRRQAQEKSRKEREEFERAELAEQERVKREFTRTQVERDMAQQMQAELEREEAQVRAMQEQAARAERRDRLVDDFKRRIQAKIQAYVRLPQRISGNPEAVFQVTLFANGEVRNVTLVKSSGQPAYDVEVERAILKASPLPLPNEKEAAAVFRGGLELKFRPYEGAPGAGVQRW